LNEVLISLGISYKCFNILNEVLSSFVGKKGILIAYMTDGNHFYPVDDQEDRKKIAARHREGNKAGGRKKKNEEEEEYTIKPSMDVALYEDVTGKVYLSEQDNLNMEIVEQMSSENLIYFRGHYHLDSEGNIRELEYSNDVRFIANEKVEMTIRVCEKLGIPFVGQSYVSLGLDILDDKHKIGGKLKRSVLNNDLYNSFRRSWYVVENCQNSYPMTYDGGYYGDMLNSYREAGITFRAVKCCQPSEFHDSFQSDRSIFRQQSGKCWIHCLEKDRSWCGLSPAYIRIVHRANWLTWQLSRLIGGTIRRVKSDCVVVEGAEKEFVWKGVRDALGRKIFGGGVEQLAC